MQVALLKDAGKEAGKWPKDLDTRVNSIQVPAWFPGELLKVIQQCMAKDPTCRITMSKVAQQLQAIAATAL